MASADTVLQVAVVVLDVAVISSSLILWQLHSVEVLVQLLKSVINNNNSNYSLRVSHWEKENEIIKRQTGNDRVY